MKARATLLASAALSGCFGWPAVPADRPDPVLRKLADGKVQSLDVNLKDQVGLCPSKEGKLYAKGMVLWPGQKPVMRTIGNDVDSFPPAAFQVKGPLLKSDAEAHLHPSNDVLASVETGFEATITYLNEPQRFTWQKVIRPEYSCFSTYTVAGREGAYGGDGVTPGRADYGIDGDPGGDGGEGNPGTDAGNIRAVVTVVATPFYRKLYAVIANDTFFLVPPDRELWFVASGGPGGAGGRGGDGGEGGWQPWEEKTTYEDGNEVQKRFAAGRAGRGGQGGSGADGGKGGNGGVIEITYDSKFPELKSWIQTDVRPGAGGARGGRGEGGAGGDSEADVGAAAGPAGQPGAEGRNDGRDGRPGRATVRPGNVAASFNMRGIAIYGTPAAQSISTKADQPAIVDAGRGTPRPPMGGTPATTSRPPPGAPPTTMPPSTGTGRKPKRPFGGGR
jgi:hypothetical protein